MLPPSDPSPHKTPPPLLDEMTKMRTITVVCPGRIESLSEAPVRNTHRKGQINISFLRHPSQNKKGPSE